MSNKANFLRLVSAEPTDTVVQNQSRIKNRAMLRASQEIALKVLAKLDEKSWTQKDLARALDVTPQQVSKIVSGKENLTLDTITKLQQVLDIALLVSYREQQSRPGTVLHFSQKITRVHIHPLVLRRTYTKTMPTQSIIAQAFSDIYEQPLESWESITN